MSKQTVEIKILTNKILKMQHQMTKEQLIQPTHELN